MSDYYQRRRFAMEQNTVTINQLIAQILDEMRRIGYSETTIWRYYQPAMGQFRKYYVQTGQAAYSPEITDEYISLNKERYERGEVTYQSFKKTRYVGRRMNEFFLSGQFRYTSQKRGTSFMLSEGNERIRKFLYTGTAVIKKGEQHLIPAPFPCRCVRQCQKCFGFFLVQISHLLFVCLFIRNRQDLLTFSFSGLTPS